MKQFHIKVLPSSLERCLFDYVRGDSFNTPFDLRVVPVTSQPLSQPEKRAPVLADVPAEKPAAAKKEPYAGAEVTLSAYDYSFLRLRLILSTFCFCSFSTDFIAEQLAQIPEFASLGPLFHSSPRIALTDDVTEYTVHAIKHIFTNHVVVQVRLGPFSLYFIAEGILAVSDLFIKAVFGPHPR